MRLKIVVAGPKGTGKTSISNLLSGHSEPQGLTSTNEPEPYNPTAGVRILECEFHDESVELWDMSGDQIYEGCWKAIMQDADGCLLCYNPDAPSQDQQIGDWFDYFVRRNNMKDEQCLLFAHRTSTETKGDKFRPPPLFQRVTAALTTPSSPNEIRGMFENFVKELSSMKRRK